MASRSHTELRRHVARTGAILAAICLAASTDAAPLVNVGAERPGADDELISSTVPPASIDRGYNDAAGTTRTASIARFGSIETNAQSGVQTSSAGFTYETKGSATWGDSMTIDAPGLDGKKGFVTVSLHLTGAATAASPAESRFLALGSFFYSLSVNNQSSSGFFSRFGNGTTQGADFNGQSITLKAPMVFGDRFPIGAVVTSLARTTTDTVGGASATGAASSNWGGLASVTDEAGNPVSNYVVTSDGGMDYSGPVTSAGPTPAPTPIRRQSELANISTRLAVAENEKVLIAGFIVTGPAGSEKMVALRGIGPSLVDRGIAEALRNPLLELYGADGGLIWRNDNWQSGEPAYPSQRQLIEQELVAPENPSESTIIAALRPGAYTAVLSRSTGEGGIGLVELYDLRLGSIPQIANISTRGVAATGEGVMIAGVIIPGTSPSRVLVRAIGPSLAAAGVANALQDPTLDLRNLDGERVASNDDWRWIDNTNPRESQEQDILATGAQPSDEREAAIVTTLVPGRYTAIVGAKGGASGVGLIEVYGL